MGFVQRVFQRRALDVGSASSTLVDLGFGLRTSAGVHVTEEGALNYAAVYACVRVLAETLASVPLKTFERLERGKEPATGHSLYRLLHDRPNPLMTSVTLRETLMGHLCLWGNAYAEIELTEGGQVAALWPLRPDKMEKIEAAGEGLLYHYRLPGGQLAVLPGWRVLHVLGLSPDGVMGYSPIALMRQGIGLGIATETFGSTFFGNGARPGGILVHPGVLPDEAYERLYESWYGKFGGLGNSNRIAILEEGVTYTSIGVPPEDAQFLETRKFQRSEVAGWFRVPPHMIGDLERATFSNIEHQAIEFVKYTMLPWFSRWEQALDAKLLSEGERERYFTRFVVDGLMRGDTTSRYQAYAIGRQNGWLSANDIRELEEMNPIEGGDVYLVPLNMVDAGEGARGQGPGAREEGMADDGRQTTEEEEEGARGQGAGAREERVRLSNGREIRAGQLGAARKRQGLQRTYRGLYGDVTGRVARREAAEVGKAARAILGTRSVKDFRRWLDEFYEEHATWTARQLRPVTEAYAGQVGELVAAELGREEGPALTNFTARYVETAGARRATRGRKRIEGILDEPRELVDADGDGEPDVLEAIEAEIAGWEEGAAGWAEDEAVRAGNALALAAYGAEGVTRKTWVTIGDSCPYCDELSGATMEIERPFVANGQALGAGRGEPLVVGTDIGHAPAHKGCDCVVVAG